MEHQFLIKIKSDDKNETVKDWLEDAIEEYFTIMHERESVEGDIVITSVSHCPKCGYEYPHRYEDGSFLCDECNHNW